MPIEVSSSACYSLAKHGHVALRIRVRSDATRPTRQAPTCSWSPISSRRFLTPRPSIKHCAYSSSYLAAKRLAAVGSQRAALVRKPSRSVVPARLAAECQVVSSASRVAERRDEKLRVLLVLEAGVVH